VAEHAIGLALAAGRRYHDGRLCIESNRWPDEPQTFLGVELRDSVIGIVGYGQIGHAIAEKLQSFKPQKIIYSRRYEKDEAEKFSAKFVAFDELLKSSDFIFITCALTQQTRKLFNAETFEKMKKKSVLINVARGDIVDHDALYDALKNFSIFGAGLDVASPEPFPCNHPLMSLNNCGN
jgi:lactate dehydrogenase-like 2-hydroxyacid dehydrogenase